MTTKNFTKNKSSNNKPCIPTREEFHRYASNVLSDSDFCTDFPGYPYYQVNKVASSLKWTYNNEKRRNINCNH